MLWGHLQICFHFLLVRTPYCPSAAREPQHFPLNGHTNHRLPSPSLVSPRTYPYSSGNKCGHLFSAVLSLLSAATLFNYQALSL